VGEANPYFEKQRPADTVAMPAINERRDTLDIVVHLLRGHKISHILGAKGLLSIANCSCGKHAGGKLLFEGDVAVIRQM
jgi:hypothetical protein